MAEPQRALAIRLRARRARGRRIGKNLVRRNPGAVPGRVGSVGRDEARRPPLVSPDVHCAEGLGGQRILLHFGAVDWEATVWVNGKKLGNHRGGYDAFSFDITDALKRDGEQELVVGVWDPTDAGTQPRGKQVRKPGGIFYTPTTGIWQTVWLEPVPKTGIEALKIVPDVDAGRPSMCSVTLHGIEPRAIVSHVMVKGPKSHDVNGRDARPPSKPALSTLAGQNCPWSPGRPFLYDLEVMLVAGKDGKTDRHGRPATSACARSRVGKDDKGVTAHPAQRQADLPGRPARSGLLARRPLHRADRRGPEVRHRDHQEARLQHDPQARQGRAGSAGTTGATSSACSCGRTCPAATGASRPNKGEIKRSPESAQQYERELKAMIDGLHNHPVHRDVGGRSTKAGASSTPTRITEWTKKYDPTRLVDCASGWNDMKRRRRARHSRLPRPRRARAGAEAGGVLGEFGGLGLASTGTPGRTRPGATAAPRARPT